MALILIIDDDKPICETMTRLFTGLGHQVRSAPTLSQGEDIVNAETVDVVFLDVRLPDGNGIERMPAIQNAPSEPEVIILTGYADPDSAELAIRSNAWDYLKKPASVEAINLTLNQALQYRREKRAGHATVALKRDRIIGESAKIKACLDLVARSAATNANILITGETGTGKELFARAIHANSQRAHKNFVVVDCGSLPETLTESILFGHTKGAYTGADRSEDGLIKNAEGGTLFLDEIGELPLHVQKAFLRVLQERRFYPVGAVQEVKSDFRLISASNRLLDEMVKEGRFRSDLLFRLRTIAIELPPLRERTEDIRNLAIDYMYRLCESHQIGLKGFAPEFFEVLSAYSWPGNVRELFSVLEWALAQALHEQTIFPKHLPHPIRVQVARSHFDATVEEPLTLSPPPVQTPDGELPKWKIYRRALVSEGETRYLKALMAHSDSNIQEASDLSGISKPRLYELLRKHGIRTR